MRQDSLPRAGNRRPRKALSSRTRGEFHDFERPKFQRAIAWIGNQRHGPHDDIIVTRAKVDVGERGRVVGQDVVVAAKRIDLDELHALLPDVEVSISARDARFLTGDHSLDPDEPQDQLRGGYPIVTTKPTRLLTSTFVGVDSGRGVLLSGGANAPSVYLYT